MRSVLGDYGISRESARTFDSTSTLNVGLILFMICVKLSRDTLGLIILIILNGPTFLAASFARFVSISFAACFKEILRVSRSTKSPA